MIKQVTRASLSKKYNISKYQWQKYYDEVLLYLGDYFKSVKEIKKTATSSMFEIEFWEDEEDWPDIPKFNPRKTSMEERIKFFDEASKTYNEILPKKDYEPRSKINAAKFCLDKLEVDKKFGLTNKNTIAYNYVGPAMEKNGVKDPENVWCAKDIKAVGGYRLLNEEEEEYLKKCFTNCDLSEKQMAAKFMDICDRLAKGAPIDKAIVKNFTRALDMFKGKYNFTPVRISLWVDKAALPF